MSPKNEPAPDTEAVQDASGAAGHSERAIEVARQSGGGLVSRNACFAFVVGVLVAIAAVAAFHVSERSAVRRADADALGLVVDRTADHLAARVTDRGAALDTETFSMLQSEIVRLAEVRGVQQAALVFERGAEIIAAQSSQFTADHGGARLPVPDVDGPGRFLADNHLLVARSFLLRPGDDSEALLVVRAGFPSLESHMRDLVSLGGRIVGITALLLVFLLPLAGRAVFRAHTRAAQKARDGDVPDPVEAANGGRELVDLVLRIAADAERVRDADRARVELADRARAELGKARDAIARERETAQSALSEARDARAARANFVANMSHEIRTPLHAVMGTTALLLETELSADQRSLTDRSMRAARTLLSLVDDVLDLTRFDARQVVLDSAPFDPGALVEEIAEVAAPLAAQKGLDVAAFVSAECPAALMGDTARIRQALMRLVDNAIKFTDTGEVTVDVGWEVLEDGVPRALFTVSDTGIGVGEDERTRLFQAFEQIDGSNTRRHGGVGLGLALVARIARAAHGEVRIQSRAGQGARFTLALPLETADGTRGLADRVASRRTPLDGVSVLILDDAEHASRLLARTLQGLGAQTRIEPSTYSGFETFVAGAYDLVLLDGDLAGRDAFLGALVSHETKSEVPVVLMTTPLSRRDVDEAGGDALVAAAIRKPLSRAAVEEVALRALGRLEPDGPEQPEDVESTRETRKAMLDTHLRRRIRVLLVEDNQT
ncbi:MAG: ATP-binding protein, partial [Planctomycetota bacterium]